MVYQSMVNSNCLPYYLGTRFRGLCYDNVLASEKSHCRSPTENCMDPAIVLLRTCDANLITGHVHTIYGSTWQAPVVYGHVVIEGTALLSY